MGDEHVFKIFLPVRQVIHEPFLFRFSASNLPGTHQHGARRTKQQQVAPRGGLPFSSMAPELELAAAALLFPPRFVVMAVAEVLAYLACWIATIGHDPAMPLASWRRQLVQSVVVPCCRVVLATVGIWSVRIHGTPDPTAKLVVCNHVCMLDGFVLVACLGAPSFVARREGLAAVPLYGTIVRTAVQTWEPLTADRPIPRSKMPRCVRCRCCS